MESIDPAQQASEWILRRRALWVPGGTGSVATKAGDSMRIGGVENDRCATIDLIQFERLLLALSKRRKSAGYRSAQKPVSTQTTTAPADTALHAILPRKNTVHLHSAVALLMSFERHRSSRFERWISREGVGKVAFVPYTADPLDLAARLVKCRSASVIFLENHGVIIQSDGSLVETLKRWWRVENRFCVKWAYSTVQCVMGGAYLWVTPGPMKHYYPESGLWRERIRQVCEEPTPGSFALKTTAWRSDWHAAELFWVSRLLFASCPLLKEIPGSGRFRQTGA